MNIHANEMKSYLLGLIKEIEINPHRFSTVKEESFTPQRKFSSHLQE